jgi:hypothetical protein
MRKLALAILVFALGSVAALAADFNGKWTAEVQGRNGTQTMTFDFKVSGSALTGKVSTQRGDSDISDGKVDGDNISFTQTMSMNGNDMKVTYTGKADGSDTINFTRQMGDRPGTPVVAKRAK